MYENKKILVLGFARSGYACAKILANLNTQVILNDSKEESLLNQDQIKELKDLGITCIFASHPDNLLDKTFDYVIKNPGIRNDHKYVKLAKELNIPVINEVEFAYHLLPSDVNIIAITGTNGKTTTTTLTYNILKKGMDRVHLAGNIGYPLCSILDKIKSGDTIVMEISCQQLANLDEFKPHIALLTNLTPAHIDFFGDYETYKNVKTKLFKNQTENDIAILNKDNLDSLEYENTIKSKKIYFTTEIKTNAYFKDNNLYYENELIMNRDLMFLKGNHNVSNALGAITIAKIMNIDNEIIVDVLKNFRGVEHRLEFVDSINKRKFYNDTEATNIKCTQIALSSFSEPIILFLGGLERGQKFEELTPFMKNVRVIIGIGECRERVREYANSLKIENYIYEHLKDGFKKAYEISEEEEIILLSPASASWDQYKECEQRGSEFKKLVEELKDGNN